MKNIKRNIAGVFFTVLLSCSVVFAEGEMGGGGFAGTEDPVKVNQSATADGEMGGGGFSSESQTGYVDSVWAAISVYLDSIL